jgi:hypothetical protein
MVLIDIEKIYYLGIKMGKDNTQASEQTARNPELVFCINLTWNGIQNIITKLQEGSDNESIETSYRNLKKCLDELSTIYSKDPEVKKLQDNIKSLQKVLGENIEEFKISTEREKNLSALLPAFQSSSTVLIIDQLKRGTKPSVPKTYKPNPTKSEEENIKAQKKAEQKLIQHTRLFPPTQNVKLRPFEQDIKTMFENHPQFDAISQQYQKMDEILSKIETKDGVDYSKISQKIQPVWGKGFAINISAEVLESQFLDQNTSKIDFDKAAKYVLKHQEKQLRAISKISKLVSDTNSKSAKQNRQTNLTPIPKTLTRSQSEGANKQTESKTASRNTRSASAPNIKDQAKALVSSLPNLRKKKSSETIKTPSQTEQVDYNSMVAELKKRQRTHSEEIHPVSEKIRQKQRSASSPAVLESRQSQPNLLQQAIQFISDLFTKKDVTISTQPIPPAVPSIEQQKTKLTRVAKASELSTATMLTHQPLPVVSLADLKRSRLKPTGMKLDDGTQSASPPPVAPKPQGSEIKRDMP